MKKLLNKLTITQKFTLFYAAIFSITLFLLSAGALLSVEVYQIFASHKDIQIAKDAIISEEFNEQEIMDTVKLMEVKNINIMIKSDNDILFKSQGFDYNFLSSIPLDKIWGYDDDDEHYVSEKSEFILNGTTYDLFIVKNLYSEKHFLRILFFIMGAIDIVGMVISVILGHHFAIRMLKPIGDITNTAKSISAENLSIRIPLPESHDELYTLSKTFNDMADGLELAFKKQAQFVADASHELKTPIAAIKGHANLICRWGKNDKEALEHSIDSIQQEADYMTQLISKLLFLAKLDAGKAITKETFNLSALLEEMTLEMKLYNENHIVDCICQDNIFVNSDKSMVKQIIRILTDNAFKFTPHGGTITLLCSSATNKIIVEIKDTGCGMDKETMNHIFDRFYTENQSRNKNISGNGLGLSIAKSICKILNIEMEVKSNLNEGSIFKLTFT